MKKTENLILRVDPDLKSIIDKKAEDQGITTSEMVREILSVIFLVDYENLKLKKYIVDKLQDHKKVLEQIINNPMISENEKIKEFARKSFRNCLDLEKSIVRRL